MSENILGAIVNSADCLVELIGPEIVTASSPVDLPNGTGLVVHAHGIKEWYLHGKLHREDGPAVEWMNGTKFWYLNGETHREDGPAIEWADGTNEYWLWNNYMSEAEFLEWTQMNQKVDPKGTPKSEDSHDGVLVEFPLGTEENPAKSVDDLPNGTGLVMNNCGSKFWYKNCLYHREDGPAVEWSFGKLWFNDGSLHRVDGPAIEEPDGNKEWFLHGERHRVDGPAVERANGSKFWYLNGEELSEAEFLERIQ